MNAIQNILFWRRLFLSAAVFNWGAAVVFAFFYRDLVRLLGIAPAAEPALYLQLFSLAVAMFGCGYYMVSRDLSQTAVVRIGAWAKLGVTALLCGYWWIGVASWQLPLLTGVDAVYALFFFAFLAQAKSNQT